MIYSWTTPQTETFLRLCYDYGELNEYNQSKSAEKMCGSYFCREIMNETIMLLLLSLEFLHFCLDKQDMMEKKLGFAYSEIN